MKKILILEDDLKLNDGIKLALENNDYNFYQCSRIKEARKVISRESIDLILLDINLPDGLGLSFLKEIRNKSNIPIIIISANNMESDIIIGLEQGADDYITKPFSLMVLRARVEVQLRKTKTSRKYFSEEFLFDFDKMVFVVRGNKVGLSKTEQRLLFLLISNKKITLERSFLIDKIWSGESEYIEEHALTVLVKRLRDKLEKDSTKPFYIKTVYGIGYSWEEDL
ncbi:response regulator transcription factor [Miniphocaeibacter massiliensis]|uniref:response regulator transcription factor n=1 Tax=Miniphocaeibacter massiliensis TaxID=2041841 RepID=UPI000C06ABD4|nr:response regulator transcription factor [Miniphocaeibacter massiliensis]